MADASPSSPGLVALLAYDGLHAFEFGIAWEVFGLPQSNIPWWYDFIVVAAESGPLKSLGGITLQANAGLKRLAKAHTIVIPGWRHISERPPERLLAALRAAHRRGARLVTLCSGAFVLAEAGLLDGRRATTHWYYAPEFKARFPRVRLDPDVLYVDEGDIVTSAGSVAAIDACLHVVRRDFGAAVANRLARNLVVPPHREGGQAQFVETPVHLKGGRGLSEVMEWARKRLDQAISTAALARRAAISERTLHRRFLESTGSTPKAWLLRERLHRAQLLLETTDLPLDRVGEATGFRSTETFRIAFRRTFHLPPLRYRRQFRASRAKTA